MEAEQSRLHAQMGEGDFYQQPGVEIAAAMERLETIKKELEDCFARWETLETLASGAPS